MPSGSCRCLRRTGLHLFGEQLLAGSARQIFSNSLSLPEGACRALSRFALFLLGLPAADCPSGIGTKPQLGCKACCSVLPAPETCRMLTGPRRAAEARGRLTTCLEGNRVVQVKSRRRGSSCVEAGCTCTSCDLVSTLVTMLAILGEVMDSLVRGEHLDT